MHYQNMRQNTSLIRNKIKITFQTCMPIRSLYRPKTIPEVCLIRFNRSTSRMNVWRLKVNCSDEEIGGGQQNT